MTAPLTEKAWAEARTARRKFTIYYDVDGQDDLATMNVEADDMDHARAIVRNRLWEAGYSYRLTSRGFRTWVKL